MHSDRDWLRAHVESVRDMPALVRDRHLDVIASNAIARALTPAFVEGVNLARFTFQDAGEYAGEECYAGAAAQITAMLRESLDRQGDDDPFRRIVGELSATSIPFAVQWAGEDAPSPSGMATFPRTPVGPLTLTYSERWIDERCEESLLLLSSDDPQTVARLAELAALLGSAG